MIVSQISIPTETYVRLLTGAILLKTSLWTSLTLLSLVVPFFLSSYSLLPIPTLLKTVLFTVLGVILWCIFFAVFLYRARHKISFRNIDLDTKFGILLALLIGLCWPLASLFLSLPWGILAGLSSQI